MSTCLLTGPFSEPRIQAQTKECLVIGEVINTHLLVVLNKVDQLPEKNRDEKVKKMTKLVKEKVLSRIQVLSFVEKLASETCLSKIRSGKGFRVLSSYSRQVYLRADFNTRRQKNSVLKQGTYHLTGFQTAKLDLNILSCLLTLAGIIFFAPLRGYRPQKWSPGESALLNDWLIRDLQI